MESKTQSSPSHTIFIVTRFEFFEHFRNRWLILYGLSFLVLASLIIYVGGANPLQASASLLSLVLLLVPIFSLIFGSISFTETLPFMELMTAQPVSRRDVYFGKFLGLGSSLSLSFVLGMGIAALMRMNTEDHGMTTFAILLVLGVLLSFLFVSIAFLLANLSLRKEVVFGSALSLWFYFFVLHDFIMMGLVVSFSDYPLESLVFTMSILNPIDLTRALLTLQMDNSSLMGASSAVMNRYLGGTTGIVFGLFMLFVWIVIPLIAGVKLFHRRDF